MISVYIALGSNVGNRAKNLRRAIALLGEEGLTAKRISSIYETEPLDYVQQAWFLNGVVEVETNLAALELLRVLRRIENRMGSKKEFAKGPRLIDLDILLYGDETVESEELQVPHPRMLARRFVMVPLVEIAPEVRHPSWSGTAKEMLEKGADRSEVRKVK